MSKKRKKKKIALIKNPLFRKIARYCFFAFLFLATSFMLLAGITNLYYRSVIKDKDVLINNNSAGILLLDNKGDPFFSFYNGKRRQYISLQEISEFAQKAAVTAEDKEFYQHGGISLRGIIRSVGLNFKNNSLTFGGSTITQQLVKNALLTPEKSFIRKYQEAVLAGQIEARYKKEEIMEMYLNSIYFGEGSFGIEDAAQTYFGKSAKDLTLSEASFLISVLPSPSRLSPYSGDRNDAVKRQKLLLSEMLADQSISRSEFENAQKESLNFKNNNEDANNIAPHFALMVRDELIKKFGEERIIRSGFTVKTTLDTSWQEYAEVAVKNHVERLAGNQVTNAATVAMDPKTGEIKSLVGSADWANEENGKVNMAIAPRQPGSSFKPIVYAKAFEDRTITPATILEDKRVTFRDPNCPSCLAYTPKNYDGEYRGNVLVRRALANSLNIPSVQVMQKVGVEKTLQKTKELGINTLNKAPSNYGLSLVLGAGEVPLIKMVQVYSSFANKGKEQEIKLYTEITDKKGETIYAADNESKQVWPENVTFLISSILSDGNARSEEFGNALNVPRTAAVKTGTTENYKDAWTIGYTPDLVVGVWVGNNDNAPMDQVAGSLGAAPIWRDLLEKFSEGTPSKDFEKPSDIIQLAVCRSSGLRAKNNSSSYTEYFISGTEPTKECEEDRKSSDKPDEDETEERIEEFLERFNDDDEDFEDLRNEIEKRREERREKRSNEKD